MTQKRVAAPPSVIVVMLRQPYRNKPTEMRSDPFWEFGSFGTTGCHQRNLMHPKKASLLNGARFAFVQGGVDGSRLVFLTPPVTAIAYGDRSEVRWEAAMPFKYDSAPLILDADGNTDFPLLAAFVKDCKRNGWMGKFASKFRSRREALPPAVARQLLTVYGAAVKSARRCPERTAGSYEEALPFLPPVVDLNRRQTYSDLVARAEAIA